MKAILPDVRQLELRRTVFVSVIGVLLVCLLALLANQLKQAIIANKNIGSELANTVSSTQAGLAKKPMRYEATINNWKRHRSSETKPTEIATKMPRE